MPRGTQLRRGRAELHTQGVRPQSFSACLLCCKLPLHLLPPPPHPNQIPGDLESQSVFWKNSRCQRNQIHLQPEPAWGGVRTVLPTFLFISLWRPRVLPAKPLSPTLWLWAVLSLGFLACTVGLILYPEQILVVQAIVRQAQVAKHTWALLTTNSDSYYSFGFIF